MATKTNTTKTNTKNRWDAGGFKARDLKPGEKITKPQPVSKKRK